MHKIILAWSAIGAIAGALQAWLLWQASKETCRPVRWHVGRAFLVTAILVLAVFSRQFLPLGVGWSLAYFGTVAGTWWGNAQ